MKKYFVFLFFLIIFEYSYSSVIINEASSANSIAIVDEEQDSPDWIELYNSGDEAINIKSWRIGDGKKFDKAWEFPDVSIEPKSHLLVYASDKNYANSGKYIMEAGGNGIFTLSFSDAFRFEYLEMEGDFTFSTKVHSLSNVGPRGTAGLIVREGLNSDDSYIGVLSPNEDVRQMEFPIREYAGSYTARVESTVDVMYPYLTMQVARLGDSLIAAIYDYEGYCLDYYGRVMPNLSEKVYVGLVLSSATEDKIAKASFSELKINGLDADYTDLIVADIGLEEQGKSYFSDELHTDFKLSRKGETITLWNSEGDIIDQMNMPKMYVDMSFGRYPDGSDNFTYFLPPTPKKENDNPKKGILDNAKFSLDAGIYGNSVDVVITHDNKDATIYYTLDGSEPTEESEVYSGDIIHFNSNGVIKARVYLDDYIPSEIETASYLINIPEVNLPTLSLTSNSEYFFDKNKGLFTHPKDHLEYPGTIEYFSREGNRDITNRIGIKTNGQTTTLENQVSMRFSSKSKYGESSMAYPFFGLVGDKEYDKVIIRNAGQNWYSTFINDGFIAVVGNYIDNIFGMQYQPVMVYLNNEFWGMYNLRERLDDDFLSIKFKVSTKSISIIEAPRRLMQGSARTYFDLVDSAPILSDEEIYDYMDKVIDIDNFIDYNAVSFWANNTDWPMSNFKLWRSSELDNKWRWILKDFDIALEHDIFNRYDYDYLPVVMDSVESNPDFYHFGVILKNAFRNEQFRNKYLNRHCDLMNSTLTSDVLRPIFDSLVSNILDAMIYQKERWTESAPNYLYKYERIREFFVKRPYYYRESLRNYFDLSGVSKIELKSNMENAAIFSVNSLSNLSEDWTGYYLNDIPINISVTAKKGYTFQHWLLNDEVFSDYQNIWLILSDSLSLTAVFEGNDEEDDTKLGIVINEIMYKAAKDEDSDDWVELLNAGDDDVDLSGWDMKDDDNKHSFIIPEGTILQSSEFLVLVVSEELFTKFHSDVDNYIGEVGYGFGKADAVRLFDKEGNLMDSVTYTSESPWYPEANGGGPSLELRDAKLDNSLASSWQISWVKGGTPGIANSVVSVRSNILDNYIKVYPNPASASTNISFSLDFDSKIDVKICDIFGNTVKNIFDGYYQSGTYTSYWDGNNSDGKKMSAGLYFVIISTDRGIIREKMILK